MPKLPPVNPEFVQWAEHAGLDIKRVRADGIVITPGWGGPDKYRVEFDELPEVAGGFRRRVVIVDSAPPPLCDFSPHDTREEEPMIEQPRTEAIQAVADEMSGIQIGSGYYSTTINGSEARECAEAALAFIRDAIHRDGPDADAIRDALGLRVERAIAHDGRRSPHFARDGCPVRRVRGEWQPAQ